MDVSPPPQVELEEARCPLGCNSDDEFVLAGHDRLHDLPGEFRIVRCRRCGLMRTNPRPTPQTIGYYYPASYGPYLGTRVSANPRGGSRLRARLRSWLPTYSQCIPDLRPGRMLEIGCASGAFMHDMAIKGWSVEGIEFSPEAADAARSMGYPVIAGTLESVEKPLGPFDLIVGWMVIEHLHDPMSCLRRLHSWTVPGGWLALSVPNVDSADFRWFKDRNYAIHLPNHLYHFSPKTLEQVLDRTGWRVVKVHHERTPGNWVGSLGHVVTDLGLPRLGHWISDLHTHSAPLKLLLYPLSSLLAFFGQTGRMTVWAKRAE